MTSGPHDSDFAVAVIGGDRPYRSSSLRTFVDAHRSRLLDHPQCWLTSRQEAAPWIDDKASLGIWGREITLGEIGCSLSHRYAYQSALEHGKTWLLVFEDDADPDVSLATTVDLLIQEAGAHAGPLIINLDIIPAYRRAARARSSRTDETSLLQTLRYPLPNASAYLINSAAMRVALSVPWKIACPPDWPPWATMVQFRTPHKSLITTIPTPSTIPGRVDSLPIRRRLMRLAKALSCLTWLENKQHYVSFRNYLRYEFGFRTGGSVRLHILSLRRQSG